MHRSQIPILLRKLQGYMEQGDRVKLDGKVIAGGVGRWISAGSRALED